MLKFNLIQIFDKFTFEKKGTYKVTQTSYQNVHELRKGPNTLVKKVISPSNSYVYQNEVNNI